MHAAADAEQWQVPGQGRVQEPALPVVPGPVGRAGARVGGGRVPGRVDVGPAGEDESVQGVEQVPGGAGLRRQQHRGAAGPDDGVDVGLGHERGALVPDGPGGLVLVAGDADQRPSAVVAGHSRSNPRRRSQSVTALW